VFGDIGDGAAVLAAQTKAWIIRNRDRMIAAASPITALRDSDTLFEQLSNSPLAPQRLRLSQPPAPGFALSW